MHRLVHTLAQTLRRPVNHDQRLRTDRPHGSPGYRDRRDEPAAHRQLEERKIFGKVVVSL